MQVVDADVDIVPTMVPGLVCASMLFITSREERIFFPWDWIRILSLSTLKMGVSHLLWFVSVMR